MDQNQKKRAVAVAALAHLPRDAVLGVGTGSTVNCLIEAIVEHAHPIAGAVSSSAATTERLRAHGIRVLDLNDVDRIGVYVDGADEATRDRALVKGGGGALTREKIIAAASETFVCLVDDSKLVQRLGRFPIPVEVIPMARAYVGRVIAAQGAEPRWREGFETDNGNHILDVHALATDDPAIAEGVLDHIAGVVTNGLFARRPADLLLVAGPDGTEVVG